MFSTPEKRLPVFLSCKKFEFVKSSFNSLIQKAIIISSISDDNLDEIIKTSYEFIEKRDIQTDFAIIDIIIDRDNYQTIIVFFYYPIIFLFEKKIPDAFGNEVKNKLKPKTIICSSSETMDYLKQIPQAATLSFSHTEILFNLIQKSDYFTFKFVRKENPIKFIQKVFIMFVIELGKLNTDADRVQRNQETPYAKILPKKYEPDDFIIFGLNNIGRNSSRIGYCVLDHKIYFVKTYKDNIDYQREKIFYEGITIQNPYLLRYYGTIEDNTKNIVLEYINSKSLDHYQNLDIDAIFSILLSIFLSIQALHINGFLYRDLKPENVLLDINLYAILIDFDISRNVLKNDLASEDSEIQLTHAIGNLAFQSPDMNHKIYSYPLDIYSLGLFIYYIFRNEIPFHPHSNLHLPPQLFLFDELFHSCIQLNPSERPEISGLIKTFCMIVIENYNSQNSLIFFKRTLIDFFEIQFKFFKIFKKLRKSHQNHLILTKSDFFISIPELILFCSERRIYKLPQESNFILQNLISLSDYQKNTKYLHFRIQLVHTNDPYQQFQLAMYYYRLPHKQHYINQWYHYFKLASKNKIAEATFILAVNYETGKYLSKNINKSIRYYIRASNMSYVLSHTYLALLFDSDKYVSHDPQRNLFYFKLAAEQNYPLAQMHVANKILENKLFKGNHQKALFFFEQAAKSNEPVSMFIFGHLCLRGDIVPYDINKSIYYLENSNYPLAYTHLGDLYYKGKHVQRDYHKAFQYYLKSAEMKCPEGQFKTGIFYMMGQYCEFNIHKSVYYLTQSALHNNKYAQFALGLIYTNNDLSYLDYKKAIAYMTTSASQNYPDAQYILGMWYFDGIVVDFNLNSALYYLHLAATNNYAPAYLALGIIYHMSEVIPVDIKKAIYYYEKASKLNNAEARYNLGLIYADENLGVRDYDKAFSYLKLAADENNIKEAQNELANWYFLGKYVKRDLNKAKRYCELAIIQNSAPSFYLLSTIYTISPYKDPNKSLFCLQKAADLDLPEAQYELYLKYSKGDGVPRNLDTAIRLLAKSSMLGYAESQFHLGMIYYEGKLTQRNINKACIYLQKAASNKHANSNLILGTIFFEGKYLPRNIKKAIEYFQIASNAGETYSKVNLAIIYLNGDGVPKDILAAYTYLQDANTINNNAYANYNIGRILCFGLGGIEIDVFTAIVFLELASSHYFAAAIIFLYLIYSSENRRYDVKNRFPIISGKLDEIKDFTLNKELLLTNRDMRSRAFHFIKYYDHVYLYSSPFISDFIRYVNKEDFPLQFDQRIPKTVSKTIDKSFYSGLIT